MISFRNLTICIPAFNEEASIGKVVSELKTGFPEAEIIVVNDGSSDKTDSILKLIDGITFLTNTPNRGYGASIKRAMLASTREVVAWFDADGQHQVDDLKKVVSPVIKGENDVVIGIRSGNSHVVKKRVFGKFLLKLTAQLIVRQHTPDINSGLRCFRKSIIQKYLHLLPERFSASTVTTIIMIKRNYSIGYCDISTKERIGNSSVNMISDGIRALALMFNLFILFDSILFFSASSLLLFLLGGGYSIYCLLTNNNAGFPVLGAVVIIGSIMTFLIGLVSEQVTQLRKERFEN